jgi:hypothetical protein
MCGLVKSQEDCLCFGISILLGAADELSNDYLDN